MSASLVGSEMCIRDRQQGPLRQSHSKSGRVRRFWRQLCDGHRGNHQDNGGLPAVAAALAVSAALGVSAAAA
eukprot:10735623-Alexandrium_andersonii.AAC.1